MRLLTLFVVSVSSSVAFAQIPPAAVEIGPWKIEVSYTGEGAFDRCIMSRTTDEG